MAEQRAVAQEFEEAQNNRIWYLTKENAELKRRIWKKTDQSSLIYSWQEVEVLTLTIINAPNNFILLLLLTVYLIIYTIYFLLVSLIMFYYFSVSNFLNCPLLYKLHP